MQPDRLKSRLVNLKTAAFLFMVTVILFCLSSTTADPDLWGYLVFGRLYWGQEKFPYLDVFAYVPTLKPWIYHEWLTGVLFYPLYRTLGAPGLQILKYTLGLATVGVTYLTARRRGADLLPTALILGSSVVGISVGYSAVRAQVSTYFFFAVSIYLLETARLSGQGRGLWLLVPIQLLWCNLHGGFLAGLGLIFLYALGEALARRPFRAYLGWFLIAGLATLVNPYGLKYWIYLVQAVTMPRPEITEWASLLESYRQGYVGEQEFFFFLSFIAVVVLLAWWARWREITPALVILFTGYLAVTHYRHVVFLTLTVGAFMPVLLTAYFRELSTRPSVVVWVQRLGRKIPTLAVIFFTGFLAYRFVSCHPLQLVVTSEPQWGAPTGIYYPVGAIDFLEQRQLSGKLLVYFNWGEYCLWRLYPRCLVAIDGRYETVYPEKVHKEYFDFLNGREGWQNFLKHYPPDLILVELRSRVYGLLGGDPEWRQVYADSGCALFRHSSQVSPGPAQDPNRP